MTETTTMSRPHTIRHAINTGKMNRRAWTITALLVVLQIIAFADRAVLGLVAPSAMAELGMTTTQFGFMGSAFYFLYAVVAVATGVLASKFSVKWILFVMGLTWALVQFPMLFGGGAAVLLVTRIVLGGAEGPATPTALASVHSWFPASRRALPSNFVAIGSTLGPVVAAPLLAVVIAAWGWRWAFGVLGIVGLVWLVFWLFLGQDGPYGANAEKVKSIEVRESDEPGPHGENDNPYAWFDTQKTVPIFKALLSGTFLVTTLGAFANFWNMGFLTTWLPQYLQVSANLTITEVGVVTIFPWLFGALLLLGLGFISRHLMKKAASVRLAMSVPFSLALVIGGVSFMLTTQVSGVLAIVLLTIAAGCSLIYPMGGAIVAYTVGMKQRPVLLGTLAGVGSLGAIISPALVGWLMEKAGYVPAAEINEASAEMVMNMITGANHSFIIAGIVLLLAGLLCLAYMRPDLTAQKLQASVEQQTSDLPTS